jgi:catechol 2,3-dioxygenase-like lactoylglutathione lyase family enzyme
MISHIIIPTLHYEKTVTFYRDVLGFHFVGEKGRASFLRPYSISGLLLVVEAIVPDSEYAPTGHGMYVSYLVDSIETLKERLQERGLSWEETSAEGFDSILIHDPADNLVLFKAVAAQPQSDRTFDQTDLELSLIASVCFEMAYAARELVTQLRKQGVADALVEPIRQFSVDLEVLRKEAHQSREQIIAGQQPTNMPEMLAARLMSPSRALYPLLKRLARIEDLESERKTQIWIGSLKGLIEGLENVPWLSSM